MTVQITIEGKVQGVFYRASTKAKAQELSLGGYVQNLSDGSVFIEAEGEENSINALLEWCKSGPPAAEVENCKWQKISHKSYNAFTIK